jgi:hypothetical protein
MASYQELLSFVSSIESETSAQRQGTIDISGVLANREGGRGADYGKLIDTIERASFEGGQPRRREERPKPAAPSAQAESIQQPTAPVATSVEEMQPVQAPEEVQAPQEEAPAHEYEAAESEMKETAKQELAGIIGRITNIEPKIEEVRVSMGMKNLVLPNLPIAEQVPELEKIIEGVRNNIFDETQTATLRKELKGLQVEISKENAAMRKSGAQLTDSEKQIRAVREQRMNEAAAMVK